MADELISSIFPEEKDISVFSDITAEVEAMRKRRFTADKKMLDNTGIVIDINNIKDIPEGRVTFRIGSAKFECMFHRGKKKKLFLILDGARTHSGGKKRSVPIFNRWSWYPYSDCSWISVEDPMYFVNDDITLGWFWGTQNENFRQYTAQLAAAIAEHLGVPKQSVVFYGGSGGGTAAIHSAALFGGGVAVSINGQVNFEYGHKDIDNFIKYTGMDIRNPDKFERNDICGVMKRYPDTRYVLVENCRSEWDLVDHARYFSKKLGIEPKYGVSRFGNIYTYLYDAAGKSPHTAFENKNTFFAINLLTEIAARGEDVEKYRSLFMLFGEIWSDEITMGEAYAAMKNTPDNLLDPLNGVAIYDPNVVAIKPEAVAETAVVENVVLEAGGDKYKNYMYTGIKPNSMYSVTVSGFSSKNNLSEYSIGLFDTVSRKFYKISGVRTGRDGEFCFSVGRSQAKLGLCIFAGLHGKTAGNSVSIAKITIKRADIR